MSAITNHYTTMDQNTENVMIEIVKRSRGRPKRETPLTVEEKNREQEISLKDITNKIMNTEDYKNIVITNELNI